MKSEVRNMNKPLYQLVMLDLQTKIRKQFESNAKLPSERTLMEQYNVSRNTIRLALDDLEQRGVIYRLHGKGTFVSPRLVNQTDLGSMYSFTQEMRDAGRNPITFNLSLEKIRPEQTVREQLNLTDDGEAYCLTRLRMADNEPLIFEESYLPAAYFPDLTMQMISGTPLYVVMKELFQETVVMAFEDIKAGIVTTKEAQALEIAEHDPCLTIFRRSINDHNVPIEFTKSVARGDRFVYRTKQNNRRVLSGDKK